MIKETFKASAMVKDRTSLQVLAKLMEEVGELSVEILKKDGFKEGEEGKDGILGEAVDVAQCALDLIFLNYPDITPEEVKQIVTLKLDKWVRKKAR